MKADTQIVRRYGLRARRGPPQRLPPRVSLASAIQHVFVQITVPGGSIEVVQSEVDRPDPVGLSHLGLSVSNLERSISFYCDVLGATLVRTPYDGDSPAFSGRMAVVIIGSLTLDLFEHSGNGGGQFDPSSTGLDHLALVAQSSEDLQRWTRWLDLQKVQHSEIRDAQGMGSMFDFADPDGIQWEFLFLDPEKLRQLEMYSQTAESQ